ncbi:hypothetical protein [Mycolicibacterium sp. CBMA 247]|uniref:hypothetical protein n=1 Tax=Mycolicibacterium sp. CBMA 247 TaxID=2606612 RepID=UPI00193DE7A0|nr:hypothetical protein [Mycolicibacterium sp. CBMA 247]
MSVLVGLVLSPLLGFTAYGISVHIAFSMQNTCLPDPGPGDSFIAVTLLAPAVLTIAATAITYTVVHLLIERAWSIYVAIAAAVLVAGLMVVYSVNSQYDPYPSTLCPTGTPPWWPWEVQ